MALDKYIIEFKITKYSWWQFSLCLVCHFGRLELTVSTEQFGLLCRQVYMKVNNQVRIKVSKSAITQKSKRINNQVLATHD